MFYGSFIEPKMIEMTHAKIDINKTPQQENLKIAFISDFHLGPYKKFDFLNNVIEKTIEQKPDLILLGGDFIFNKESEAKYFTTLDRLTAVAPTFAILGNHEYHSSYNDKSEIQNKTGLLQTTLNDTGIKILKNQNELLTINGTKFYLIGLDDIDAELDDYQKAADNLEAAIPKIILVHSPDFILKKPVGTDLILTGHTHGGQIRLPLIGSLAPIPTNLGRAYDMGLFNISGGQMFISRGIGESGTRARLFCRPEISILNVNF